ncbi:hypothetical protein IJI94_00310 [Candidatus Saccharibacteria bacterium]|nr:hypothetical protein [Candidatus Saccharibacteria bacterium]
MEIYTTSKFANYVHIHMYLIDAIFKDELTNRGLTDDDYNFNVNIDGNVAAWSLNTNSEKVIDCFADVIKNLKLDESKIKEAVKRIEVNNNFKAKIKDSALLLDELAKIKFIYEKPEITDDSLESPAIDFIKK